MDTLIHRLETGFQTGANDEQKLKDYIKKVDDLKYHYNITQINFEDEIIKNHHDIYENILFFSEFYEDADAFLKRAQSKNDIQMVRLFVDAARNEYKRLCGLFRSFAEMVEDSKSIKKKKEHESSEMHHEHSLESVSSQNETDNDFSHEVDETINPDDIPTEEKEILSLLPLNNVYKMRKLEKIEQEHTRDWVDQVFQKHHIKPDLSLYINYRKKKLSLSWFYDLKQPPENHLADFRAISNFSEPLLELIGKSKRLDALFHTRVATPFSKMKIIKETRKILTTIKDMIPSGGELFIEKELVFSVYEKLDIIFADWLKLSISFSRIVMTNGNIKQQLDFLKNYVTSLSDRLSEYRQRL